MTKRQENNPPPTQPVAIPLNNGFSVIVDADTAEKYRGYDLRAFKSGRCYYASIRVVVKGRSIWKGFHRIIAHTPDDLICHHQNRNTLDNRRANLMNMAKMEHQLLHLNNSLIIKMAPGAGHYTL